MSLVLADRVRQTSTTTGSGTFTLDGSVTGFQSFAAIGDGNTTYYTITLDSQWEVGIGTYSAGTLTRDTVISSSTGSKIVFGAGTKDVFVSYPAEKSVNQDANNRVLIPYTSGVTDVGSLNVGNATLHTDSGVIAGFTASEPLYLYTSLQNTSTANTSYASYAVNDGGHTAYAELGINNANYSYTAAGFPNNGFSTPLASFVESYGGPLVIGSWDNQKISFIVNGAVNTTDAMTINTNGSVAFNGQVGTAGQVLQSNATSAPTWVNNTTGSGTVTSVDATVPAFLSVTGGPITTSGTLAISYSGTALPIANGGTGATTQQAAINALAGSVQNSRFLAGDGTNVTMRAIAVGDVPTLNQNTTGTAANVTGTVAIANGGTGQTTASAAFNALSPVTTTGDLILGNGTNSATRLGIGTDGQILTSNGSTAAWGSRVASGTAVTLTTQATVDFTSLPSWVKRITVMFNGVSLSGTNNPLVQLGYGGTPTYVTSGYLGGAQNLSTVPSSAAEQPGNGFVIRNATAANVNIGIMNMVLLDSSTNTWVATYSGYVSTAAITFTMSSVALSGTLTAVRLTRSGTNTFDAGTINILYE